MRREDAIGAIADELVGVKGDPFDITIERSEAEPIAERVLDALAPYVVMRDQMEQVGWLDEVGYLHAAPSAADHSQDTPVYIIRGGS